MLAHIVRIDSDSNHGYQVRINLSDESSSKYRSKLFSDSRCGGKRKAKRLAEMFLESTLQQHGLENIPAGRRRGMMFAENPQRLLKSNSSGRTGVYRGRHKRLLATGTQDVRYWAASYTIGPDGKRTKRSKRFYYGVERTEEEARELAVQFREGWEQAYLESGARGVKAFFRHWSL